jgi:excisionase family DNA binding protein
MEEQNESGLYLTIQQFSQKTSLSDKTVRRRIDAGQIPYWQPGGPGTRILIPVSCLSAVSQPDEVPSVPQDCHASSDKHQPLPGPKPRWTQS